MWFLNYHQGKFLILYNGYISRNFYFPKKDVFYFFPFFNFPSCTWLH